MESSLPTDLLEEREKELLRFIYQNSRAGKLTSVAELNAVLSLNKRTVEIQKRIRTDIIVSINEKCQYLTQNQKPILQRSRAQIDKRMFEYFVEQERFEDAKSLLGLTNSTDFE